MREDMQQNGTGVFFPCARAANSPDHIAGGGQTRVEDAERESADFQYARSDEQDRRVGIKGSIASDVFLDALGRCAPEPGTEGDQGRTARHSWLWGLEEMDVFANGLQRAELG